VSLPISAPTKRASRRVRRQTITKACEVCGVLFRPHYSSPGRFCSVACRAKTQVGIKWGRNLRPCIDWAKRLGRTSAWMRRHRVSSVKVNRCNDCKVLVPKSQHRCTPCRYLRRMERRYFELRSISSRAARRRRKLLGRHKPYVDEAIFERDGYRCHLRRTGECVRPKAKCNPRANRMVDDDAPTIDHLVPLCDGGDDTPENVATAHRLCNSVRSQHGTVQLRLAA
jgi:hypothetical protein